MKPKILNVCVQVIEGGKIGKGYQTRPQVKKENFLKVKVLQL